MFDQRCRPHLCVFDTLHRLHSWEVVYRCIPDEQDVIEATLIDLVLCQTRGLCNIKTTFYNTVLASQVDNQKCCFVVTTGGTGPAPRDVTPEATERVCIVFAIVSGQNVQYRMCAYHALAQHCPYCCIRQCTALVQHPSHCTRPLVSPTPSLISPTPTLPHCSTTATPPQVCDRMMPGYGEQMRAISLRYVPTAVLSRQTAGLRKHALILNLPGSPKSIRETIDEVFRSVPACVQLLEGPYIQTHTSVVDAFRPKYLIRSTKA